MGHSDWLITIWIINEFENSRWDTVSSVWYIFSIETKNIEVNGEVKLSKSMLIETGYPNFLHGYIIFFVFTWWIINELEKVIAIGHVRYINILTWLWGFLVKLLYLVLLSLYLSLFWELEDKRNVKNLQFWPESLGAMLEYWYIERGLSFFGNFVQGGKAQWGEPRVERQTVRQGLTTTTICDKFVDYLKSPVNSVALRLQKTAPTVYGPKLRWKTSPNNTGPERARIWKCHDCSSLKLDLNSRLGLFERWITLSTG